MSSALRCHILVRAPIPGIITHVHTKLGTSIIRNDKLFEVAQLSPLEVRFQLPLSEHGRFGPGGVLGLSLPGNAGLAARARIRQLDPIADVSSSRVVARQANPSQPIPER
ncbi:MAG: HlyD family efflux transporter periplasmic adaptor subunit [Acidobacteria bacterium]|nr:MAG: HlyD family efflux transporter periplasmic adaptor subunit [Acidobacteriota bacterium]